MLVMILMKVKLCLCYLQKILGKSTNEISDNAVSRYLYVFICVESGLGPPPPDIGPDCSTHN
jgi:hypothetical protein